MKLRFGTFLWVGVLAALLVPAVHAVPDRRGFEVPPYLHSIEGKSIAVAWKPVMPRQSETLELFRGASLLARMNVRPNAGLFRAVLPIGVCGFGNDLAYQIGDRRYPIREVPCEDSAGRVKFSFLTDTHGNSLLGEQLAKLSAKFDGAFLLFGGDPVDTGTNEEEWMKFFYRLHPVSHQSVVFPVVGNHDYRGDASVPGWPRFFGTHAKDAFYEFHAGPVHFIFLNSCFSDDRSLENRQVSWLKQRLSLSRAPWKVVVFHHPPYSISAMHHPLYPKKEWQIIRQKFIPLFEKYGVNLVLNGHTHIFERSEKAGISYVTGGRSGAYPGFSRVENPYLVTGSYSPTVIHVEADQAELQVTTLNQDGGILDTLKQVR